jgi:hypothetical protein
MSQAMVDKVNPRGLPKLNLGGLLQRFGLDRDTGYPRRTNAW